MSQLDHAESMEFFSKVENVFTIAGRGCVIVPAKPIEGVGFPVSLRDNDLIQLRGPAGFIDTHIAAIESLNVKPGPRRLAILLPSEIAKSDVSPEMEIWAESSRKPTTDLVRPMQ
ncbi:MAG: hypothetical protein ABSG51_05325 [Terracidiphilus sp.]